MVAFSTNFAPMMGTFYDSQRTASMSRAAHSDPPGSTSAHPSPITVSLPEIQTKIKNITLMGTVLKKTKIGANFAKGYL